VIGRRSWLLALALAATASPARAQTTPAPDVTVNGGSPEIAPPEVSVNGARISNGPMSPTDAALERVLRSGCRDGLDDLHALRGNPDAPWAPTVARLCDDIVRRPPMVVAETPDRGEAKSANEGRGRLVLWSSLYGIWLGIASDVLLDFGGSRGAIIPPIAGMGAGLALSLSVTADHPLTTGQAWTIITGLDYGSYHGALWGEALGLSDKGIVAASLASSAAATVVGALVAASQSPRAGDIELVRSGLLWGTASGLLAYGAFSSHTGNTDQALAASGALAMDIGFAAGIGLAHTFDLSRTRVLIIDAGALGGGLVGFGIAEFITNENNPSGRTLAAGTLGGLLAGIAVAAFAGRHLDDDDRQARAASFPALLARDPDGSWRIGVPATTPVASVTGARAIGASWSALGGVF
jgi:hypothetical protein